MCVYFFSEESNKKHPFPCPTTYRTALTHYLDITNTPRTNVLYELAQYATDPKDQENMRKMASSSPEGKVSIAGTRAKVTPSAKSNKMPYSSPDNRHFTRLQAIL